MMALFVALVLTLISQTWSAPHKRNWTPQAILYLKGAQGHRSVVERSSREDAFSDEINSLSSDLLKITPPVHMLLQRLMEKGGDDPYEELSSLL